VPLAPWTTAPNPMHLRAAYWTMRQKAVPRRCASLTCTPIMRNIAGGGGHRVLTCPSGRPPDRTFSHSVGLPVTTRLRNALYHCEPLLARRAQNTISYALRRGPRYSPRAPENVRRYMTVDDKDTARSQSCARIGTSSRPSLFVLEQSCKCDKVPCSLVRDDTIAAGPLPFTQ
jgi:hypothetical protein